MADMTAVESKKFQIHQKTMVYTLHLGVNLKKQQWLGKLPSTVHKSYYQIQTIHVRIPTGFSLHGPSSRIFMYVTWNC
jgi:hypothetical protein